MPRHLLQCPKTGRFIPRNRQPTPAAMSSTEASTSVTVTSDQFATMKGDNAEHAAELRNTSKQTEENRREIRRVEDGYRAELSELRKALTEADTRHTKALADAQIEYRKDREPNNGNIIKAASVLLTVIGLLFSLAQWQISSMGDKIAAAKNAGVSAAEATESRLKEAHTKDLAVVTARLDDTIERKKELERTVDQLRHEFDTDIPSVSEFAEFRSDFAVVEERLSSTRSLVDTMGTRAERIATTEASLTALTGTVATLTERLKGNEGYTQRAHDFIKDNRGEIDRAAQEQARRAPRLGALEALTAQHETHLASIDSELGIRSGRIGGNEAAIAQIRGAMEGMVSEVEAQNRALAGFLETGMGSLYAMLQLAQPEVQWPDWSPPDASKIPAAAFVRLGDFNGTGK
ncbi:MAG: hypothetical protein AAFQ53_07495 [Bacteroidota bacterium]